MSGSVLPLVAVLLVWMGMSIRAGFLRRFVLFAGLLVSALMLNMIWMAWGLGAQAFERDALVAQAALSVYIFGAFCLGLFAARIRRLWAESKVDRRGV